MEGKSQADLEAMCIRIDRMTAVKKAANRRYFASKLASDPTYFAKKKAAYRLKVKKAQAEAIEVRSI